MTRLVLALVLVGLVPTGFAVYRLIDINREGMTDQVERTLALATRSKANEVAGVIEAWLSSARALATNAALQNPTSAAARGLLVDHLEATSNTGVLAIAFVNPEGERYLHALVTTDEPRRAAIEAALDPIAPSEIVAFPSESGPLIRVSTPLAGALGYVWLVCDGARVEAGLEAYELGDDAKLALIDRSSLALVGTTDGFPATLLAEATSGQVQGVRSRFKMGDSIEFVGTYHPVGFGNLTVLGRQPISEAHRVANQMRREALLALGLALLLVGGLAGVAYSTSIRPIRSLIDAQRQLAGLGTSAGVGRGNEIQELRKSFDALRKGIRDRNEVDDVFLGRYQIRKVIGSGAMGTVFLAHDPKLMREVALKTIRLDRQLDPKRRQDLIRRLLKEAITGARFNHPNIVAVYDVEDSTEAAFLAMEYVDGQSLETLLWETGQLRFELAIPLGAAIARGLEAAHSHELVHRDVKPANVLLGKDGAIKLTDFGISELISALSEEPDVVFGTPGYLPPETIRGKGYDKSGDLFSLGAVLYYCLTGSRAFDGANAKEAIRKTLQGSVKRPTKLNSTIPADLEKLVLELLANERDQRPSDATSVAEALEGMMRHYNLAWRAPAKPSGSHAGEVGRFVPTVRVDSSANVALGSDDLY